jgi:hypothetical protein
MDNIQRAVEIVKTWKPNEWAKTRENKAKAVEMAELLTQLSGASGWCGSWCARNEIFKHLRKWLEGNAHL